MNVFEMPVHPAADLFPMMAADDLRELADDIAANGLLHPIVVKGNQIIDGRNRREACLLAGVTPQIEEFPGDPLALILSANVNRRHLTKGQRAMAVAMIYPDPAKLKRNGSVKNTEQVSAEYISHARTVLKWLPEIAALVMAGSKPLNDAYATALRIRTDAEAGPKRIELLRERAPELADDVAEGRKSIADAESEFAARISDGERDRRAAIDSLAGIERLVDYFAEGPRREYTAAAIRAAPDDEQARIRATFARWKTNISEMEKLL